MIAIRLWMADEEINDADVRNLVCSAGSRLPS